MYTIWLGKIAWVSKIQRQSRVYEGKRNKSNHIITNISIYYFQSITRDDRCICLQPIFKSFSKLEISMLLQLRTLTMKLQSKLTMEKCLQHGSQDYKYRKIEIKRPCLKDVPFKPSSTRYSDCYGHLHCKEMGCQWSKRGNKLSLTITALWKEKLRLLRY